jgi:hypothetical protein
MIGLKEWSAAIHALLDGRQTVLLRKGGIHEKRFALASNEFLLFPTVAHGHAERVRSEYQALIDVARADSAGDAVVIRAAAKVVGAVEVHNVKGLPDIEDLHIWTADSVRADRLDFRPRHRLTVLTVQVYPLVAPVRLAREPEFAGCKSWIDVPVDSQLGAPRYDVAELAEVARRVADTVGC